MSPPTSIEDEIDVVNHFLEARGGVVDELVGSQFAQEVTIARRGGRDDMRACPASQLDGKDAHASRASVDQDGLPRDQARVFEEALPGRQGGQRNGCGLHMVERVVVWEPAHQGGQWCSPLRRHLGHSLTWHRPPLLRRVR